MKYVSIRQITIVTVVVMCDLCIRKSTHNYNCFFIMTKEEFLHLQELQRNSGLPLMKYLDKVGLKVSIR